MLHLGALFCYFVDSVAVADPGCLFRILDPTTTKMGRAGKISCLTGNFFVAINLTKFKLLFYYF
jgi:hypothetical protein